MKQQLCRYCGERMPERTIRLHEAACDWKGIYEMKRPTSHATAGVPSIDAQPQPFVASLTLTKIVKETIPIQPGEGDFTMGRLLDMHLEEAVMAGQEVQSVTLDIAPETWEQMRSAMSGQGGDVPAYES